jgi:hypothetical protein
MRLSKRMIIVCGAAAVALASLGAVDGASAQNLLVNPDFETGDMSGWEVFGQNANSDVTAQSGDNGPTLPGTHNAYMDNRTDGHGLTLKQSTAGGSAGPGEVFYAFDLKLDEAEAGGVLFIEIWAEQASGGIIGGSGLMGPFWDWDWTAHSGSFMAPAGTDFLTIQIMANTGATIGSTCIVHVDNVDLNYGAVPTESSSLSAVKALYR